MKAKNITKTIMAHPEINWTPKRICQVFGFTHIDMGKMIYCRYKEKSGRLHDRPFPAEGNCEKRIHTDYSTKGAEK